MLTFQLTFAIVLLATVFLIDRSQAHLAQRHESHEPKSVYCIDCGDKCDQCVFGSIMSTLCVGVRECRKGPGESCGGPSDSWGVCGDGLICSCNQCTGCSVDSLTCFVNTCLPHQSLERSHLDLLKNYPIERIAK
ncbi:PREDICTED: neuroparsin-A-like isoform X2 [Wasmannia auropunctata]|nr:PREDICTED: neuroparsin-A-like isoform X2 [Wasmannia auropunctata]